MPARAIYTMATQKASIPQNGIPTLEQQADITAALQSIEMAKQLAKDAGAASPRRQNGKTSNSRTGNSSSSRVANTPDWNKAAAAVKAAEALAEAAAVADAATIVPIHVPAALVPAAVHFQAQIIRKSALFTNSAPPQPFLRVSAPAFAPTNTIIALELPPSAFESSSEEEDGETDDSTTPPTSPKSSSFEKLTFQPPTGDRISRFAKFFRQLEKDKAVAAEEAFTRMWIQAELLVNGLIEEEEE
jgi:hypothetical protein